MYVQFCVCSESTRRWEVSSQFNPINVVPFGREIKYLTLGAQEVICYYRLAAYLNSLLNLFFPDVTSGDQMITYRELPLVVYDIIKTWGRGNFKQSRYPLLYTILIKGDFTVYSSQQWYSADLRLGRGLVQWLRITIMWKNTLECHSSNSLGLYTPVHSIPAIAR